MERIKSAEERRLRVPHPFPTSSRALRCTRLVAVSCTVRSLSPPCAGPPSRAGGESEHKLAHSAARLARCPTLMARALSLSDMSGLACISARQRALAAARRCASAARSELETCAPRCRSCGESSGPGPSSSRCGESSRSTARKSASLRDTNQPARVPAGRAPQAVAFQKTLVGTSGMVEG